MRHMIGRDGGLGSSDRSDGDVFVRSMRVLGMKAHMAQSIWDGTNNSTLWDWGAGIFCCFSTCLYDFFLRMGELGIIIPGRGLCV